MPVLVLKILKLATYAFSSEIVHKYEKISMLPRTTVRMKPRRNVSCISLEDTSNWTILLLGKSEKVSFEWPFFCNDWLARWFKSLCIVSMAPLRSMSIDFENFTTHTHNDAQLLKGWTADDGSKLPLRVLVCTQPRELKSQSHPFHSRRYNERISHLT